MPDSIFVEYRAVIDREFAEYTPLLTQDLENDTVWQESLDQAAAKLKRLAILLQAQVQYSFEEKKRTQLKELYRQVSSWLSKLQNLNDQSPQPQQEDIQRTANQISSILDTCSAPLGVPSAHHGDQTR